MHIFVLDCQTTLKNYAFIIIDEATNDCALIDTLDSPTLFNFIKNNNLNLKYILNTHHHNDHIGGNLIFKELYPQCKIFGNYNDKDRIKGITHPVLPHDTINLFNNKLQFNVINLDGHTMGHIGFFETQKKWFFAGDTIFNLGCGRRFEGSSELFWETLQFISTLPPETLIYAAHEYTLDNIAFAKTILSTDYQHDNDFFDYCQAQADKRDENIATIPFTVDSQRKFNPFLLCNQPSSLTLPPHINHQHPAEIFNHLRKLKDIF